MVGIAAMWISIPREFQTTSIRKNNHSPEILNLNRNQSGIERLPVTVIGCDTFKIVSINIINHANLINGQSHSSEIIGLERFYKFPLQFT